MKEKFSTEHCSTKWTQKRYDRCYEDDYLEAIGDYVNMSKVSPNSFNDMANELLKDKFEWAKKHANKLPKKVEKGLDTFKDFDKKPQNYVIIGLAKLKIDKLYTQIKPNDTLVKDGNVWLTVGFDAVLQLLTGTGGQAFNNATADLGVGDDATAAAKAQAGILAATNKDYNLMDATFPTTPSGGIFTVQATWGDAEALFVWNEEAFRNGVTAGIHLNRSATALGDKSAVTQTWILSGTISMT